MNKYVLRTSLLWIAVLAVLTGIWVYRSQRTKPAMTANATGLGAGMAGLVYSAALDARDEGALSPYPDRSQCQRTNGDPCLVTPNEAFRQRLVETRVRFKRLSQEDIEAYLASGEWRGKAGGYAAQGIAGSFIVKIVGSYSNVVGLPLYETTTLLSGEGYPIRFGWLNAL